MKIRDGFVTNSSSSSFVISYKDENELSVSDEVAQQIAQSILKNALYGVEVDTVEQLEEAFRSERYMEDEEFRDPDSYLGKVFQSAKIMIEAGEKVMLLTLHTDNEDLEMMGYDLAALALNNLKNGTTLEGDGSF